MLCEFVLLDRKWVCPMMDGGCGFIYKPKDSARIDPLKPPRRQCPARQQTNDILFTDYGVGSCLHSLIIRWFGEDYRTGCGCESFVADMNRNGPAWCREHADEISAKMQAEAEKRGWKLAKLRWPTKRFCRLLVLKAIRDAEKAQR